MGEIVMSNAFDARRTISTAEGEALLWSLPALEAAGLGSVSTLPYSLKIMLESLLRNVDGKTVTEADVAKVAGWTPDSPPEGEVGYRPARVLLQDFTGVPAVVDLAAMREALRRLGGDPARINPLIPADLVIDHSVQVDSFGTCESLDKNVALEFTRNRERYEFLKWGQDAFEDFRVVPPATGIIHQVNLEYLATVVARRATDLGMILMPDTLVGTDSHTTMINGLGVLGWGVGGIEAEAAMLGQPLYMLVPEVVGVRLNGELKSGVTATDLVLTLTQILRQHGVVSKIVEYTGPGVDALSLPDRALVANMAPEYGATAGFFPVDQTTLDFLSLTGRDKEVVDRVERYCAEQGLLRDGSSTEPRFNAMVELDMSTVVPCIAGPKRPQDRLELGAVKGAFFSDLGSVYQKKVAAASAPTGEGERTDTYAAERTPVTMGDTQTTLTHGSVAIASITSCTNTSSPQLMLGAGLVAKKAVEHGLVVRPWVKTADYWDVYFAVHENAKKALDAEGISIPFPQRDVHLYQTQ